MSVTIRQLETGRRAARSGRARSLVVFLHGYGADGADLLGLADVLAPHLPDTAFAAPDAPEACLGNPFGRQWFPIPWIDGSTETAAEAGLVRAAEDLDAWLNGELARIGLAAEQCCLFGFSQGTMMALHVGLRRPVALAGIVGFSGRLLAPGRLAAEIASRPPVLLLHGNADPVVPFGDMAFAANALKIADVTVQTHVMRGTGHGISPDGLSVALAFLQEHLRGA